MNDKSVTELHVTYEISLDFANKEIGECTLIHYLGGVCHIILQGLHIFTLEAVLFFYAIYSKFCTFYLQF